MTIHGGLNNGGRVAGAMALLLFVASLAIASSPKLERVLPRGGQRGTELNVTFSGARLEDAKEILFYTHSIVAERIVETTQGHVKARVKIGAETPLGEHLLRVRCESGVTELRTFFVGAFPTVQVPAQAENTDFDHAMKLAMNVTVAGVMHREQAHYYAVELKKGQRLSAEVEGMRLGTSSALFDPFVAIMDARRFELAAADDTALLKQDCFASILAPGDGKYIVAVRDSSFGGGEDSYYRLHVGSFPRPHVIYPAGGPAGKPLAAQFIGDVSGPISQTLNLPASAGAAAFFAEQDGVSSPSPNHLRASPFANVMATPNNHEIKSATVANIDPPLAFNGIIASRGQADFFQFKARKGATLEITVFARRLGSPLDSVLTLYNAAGNQIAANDDSGGPDSYLRFNPPADGAYVVGIRDHLGPGGADYVYRIEVTAPQAAVTLAIPPVNQNGQPSQERQTICVPRGNRYATLIRATREDFGGQLQLIAEGLPAGMTMTAPPLEAGMDMVPVIFEAAADAPVAGRWCTLSARVADTKSPVSVRFRQTVSLVHGPPNNTTYYEVQTDRVAAAVTREVPFSIRIMESKTPLLQSGSMGLAVTVERKKGFAGPVILRMPHHPPGVSGAASVEVAAGQSQGVIPLNAGDGAAIGKHKIVVLAMADVNGPAWVSSQLAELEVAPPLMTGKIVMSAIEKGQGGAIACELQPQTKFQGKATLQLLGLPPLVTAEPKEIMSEDRHVTFTVTAGENAPPGQHRGLFCRLTLNKDGNAMVHDLGRGGVMRIDAPKASATPKIVKVAKAPATAPAQVLSRLEKLRLEQK